MTFPSQTEAYLEQHFQVRNWDRPDNDCDKKQTLRAIVKELVLKEIADKILRDTKRIRRCGVYPGDIRPRNYKGGLLVDFDVARTEPYYVFDIRPGKQTLKMKNRDLYTWEAMRKELGLNTRLRAVREVEYCKKFRRRRKKARWLCINVFFWFHVEGPRQYCQCEPHYHNNVAQTIQRRLFVVERVLGNVLHYIVVARQKHRPAGLGCPIETAVNQSTQLLLCGWLGVPNIQILRCTVSKLLGTTDLDL